VVNIQPVLLFWFFDVAIEGEDIIYFEVAAIYVVELLWVEVRIDVLFVLIDHLLAGRFLIDIFHGGSYVDLGGGEMLALGLFVSLS
jgi:hypothetical protein